MSTHAETSLSFLDVLTNGMGSLLVLFFLMAALQSADATLPSSDSRGVGMRTAETEPFVILLTSPTNAVLFPRPNAESWRINGDPAFAARVRRDVGPTHALLYADRPPDDNEVITLHDLPTAVGVKVEVYVGRERVLAVEQQAGGDGRLVLWPRGGKP